MKSKFLICLVTTLLTSLLITACSKNSEDQLTGTGTVIHCDTVGMKYSTNVLPILQVNCYSCHGTGNTGGSGGISLDGYTNLKKWVDNGYLVGDISHASGFVAMPYGRPKLSDCDINKIIDWINQGSQNN